MNIYKGSSNNVNVFTGVQYTDFFSDKNVPKMLKVYWNQHLFAMEPYPTLPKVYYLYSLENVDIFVNCLDGP